MQGILLLAILSTKSSYAGEIEEAVSGPSDIPDTLQWWITPEGSWRIRTYAMDHDIHTHEVTGASSNLLQVALRNNEKNYGDIIASQFELSFDDCTNQEEANAVFAAAGLEPRIEIAAGRFAFWKPDDGRYFTQSAPKD